MNVRCYQLHCNHGMTLQPRNASVELTVECAKQLRVRLVQRHCGRVVEVEQVDAPVVLRRQQSCSFPSRARQHKVANQARQGPPPVSDALCVEGRARFGRGCCIYRTVHLHQLGCERGCVLAKHELWRWVLQHVMMNTGGMLVLSKQNRAAARFWCVS